MISLERPKGAPRTVSRGRPDYMDAQYVAVAESGAMPLDLTDAELATAARLG